MNINEGIGMGEDKVQLTVRKIISTGTSLLISIPKEYAELHNLKRGDLMKITFNEFLKAVPMEKDDTMLKKEHYGTKVEKAKK